LAKQQTLNGKSANGNGANLGFEQKLWAAADKLRNNINAAEYKHVVLGLIFLKYISEPRTKEDLVNAYWFIFN
jgi:type I restriction enzyme M protein